MNSITLTLEELEYLLIQNKCDYLYGFPDAFIKIDREILYKTFDKIADDLESREIIQRSFKGDINYNDDIKNIIDIIKNVNKYFDISIIEMSEISKKYRIFNTDKAYVIIEVIGKGGDKLDYSQIYIKNVEKDDLKQNANKVLCELFKVQNMKFTKQIIVKNDVYKKINKLDEDKFLANYENTDAEDDGLLRLIYKTITYAEKVLSVVVTDMDKRESKSYMYVSAFKNMIRMEFDKKRDDFRWITSQIDAEMFSKDINLLFN